MDLEMIAWFQVNWVFSLALLFVVYLFFRARKRDRDFIIAMVIFYFLAWGGWRLTSNYILNQWGLSALDAWNSGEIDHGLPNIELTILGWIYGIFVLLVAFSPDVEKEVAFAPDEEEEAKQSEKKEVQKRSTKKAVAEESLKANEKKVDDLFDDI